MPSETPETRLRIGTGLSAHPDARQAAAHACDQALNALGGSGGSEQTDLAVIFYTASHLGFVAQIGEIVRRSLRPACLIGVSAESVLGGDVELERTAGIALFAARLPGVELRPFTIEHALPVDDSSDAGLERLAGAIGATGPEDLRATLLFTDPFSVPLVKLLPALNRLRASRGDGGNGGKGAIGPIIGGLASAGGAPGVNALILNDRVMRAGGVGVSITGDVRIDCVVSQGCRPFGPTMVVTKAKGNLILELGGHPALEVVRHAVTELGEQDRSLLEKGLFIGRVINEYKERFGRNDFLIRNVVGVQENVGAIAVTDLLRVGTTVRLHLRDAVTASEDLGLLLDAQQLHDPPAGALLVTCNGRGTRLFDRPNHDASAVSRAFARDPAPPGEQKAKGGQLIGGDSEPMPLAGLFAAGEIGPIGDESFLHGHTACLALFRDV